VRRAQQAVGADLENGELVRSALRHHQLRPVRGEAHLCRIGAGAELAP
jgi:hypothetical protein